MHHIVLAEIGKHLFKLLILQTFRDGTFHQFLDTVSYKAAHLIYATLRKAIRLEGIVAARSQIAQGGKQGTIQIEDIGIEIKLSMRRHLLHTELTAMKNADILREKSDFIRTASRISVVFLLLIMAIGDTSAHGSILTKFPSLELMGLGIHYYIFILQRSLQSLHIDREHPTGSALMNHREIMVGIPFAQGRMITQQCHCLALMKMRSRNLEDHGLLEQRQLGSLITCPDYRSRIVDETALQLILIIQPEVGQDIVSIRLIHIGSRRSNRFPAHHISLGIHHLIIIGYSHKGMMTVFQSMGFSHPMITIYCVHRQIYHLPLSITCEEGDIGMQRLSPLCLV